ncbi:RHS repeat-associated core domain-containing protein, partial [Fangia hongkongensis]|uniref:RHS repeat-associated core domain-containing protein n=2 Tax=Fangia hongkongensis TaxID=270495 RepID=UPI001905971F
ILMFVYVGCALADTPALSLATDSFSYDNEYLDAESATIYLKARNLDSASMRFISQDTYNYFNRYLPFNGDPIGNIDPSGHNASAFKKGIEKFGIALAGSGTAVTSFAVSGVTLGMEGVTFSGEKGHWVSDHALNPFGLRTLFQGSKRARMAWLKGLNPLAGFEPIIDGDDGHSVGSIAYSFMGGLMSVGATYYAVKSIISPAEPLTPEEEAKIKSRSNWDPRKWQQKVSNLIQEDDRQLKTFIGGRQGYTFTNDIQARLTNMAWKFNPVGRVGAELFWRGTSFFRAMENSGAYGLTNDMIANNSFTLADRLAASAPAYVSGPFRVGYGGYNLLVATGNQSANNNRITRGHYTL